MRKLASICFLSFGLLGFGQTPEKVDLLSKHLNPSKQEEKKGIQVHQFLDTCIYDHVCGEFTGGAMKEFGLIKGAMLSIDRRLRCNQLAKSQFLPVRINSDGKVVDHWTNYRVETK